MQRRRWRDNPPGTRRGRLRSALEKPDHVILAFGETQVPRQLKGSKAQMHVGHPRYMTSTQWPGPEHQGGEG